jgi:hypothetical protein
MNAILLEFPIKITEDFFEQGLEQKVAADFRNPRMGKKTENMFSGIT